MGKIYCYTNKINGKKYIGQTIHNDNKRFSEHKYCIKNYTNEEDPSIFHKAGRKYGYENFEIEILVDNISSPDLLNQLEKDFILWYDTRIPNGYNVASGGENHEMSLQGKLKLTFERGKLTEEEIIELRLAYKNHESPMKIYNEKYKDRLHKNAFLNIWSGRRYKNIMPEVIENGRHTKLNEDIVREIRRLREEENLTYKEISELTGTTKSTVADIIRRRTWKHVQ